MPALLALSLLVPACGSSAPASADPATPAVEGSSAGAGSGEASPAAASGMPVKSDAEGSPAKEKTASAPGPGPAAAAEPPPEPAPVPLTPEEQKEADRICKPLQKALEKAAGKRGEKGLEETLDEVLKAPPKMPAADLTRCSDLVRRSIRAYVAASIEVEAKVTMTRVVKSMVAAYQRDGKLCPSSERPVPADVSRLKAAPYFTSEEGDWKGASWDCLGFSMAGQTQRFQYEVRSDPQAKTFQVIARGFPVARGGMVELVQEGAVTAKGMEVKPPVRR